MDEDPGTGRVGELVGVYHADGGLLGELRYAYGKVRGTAHCSLCDITHATVWRWRAGTLRRRRGGRTGHPRASKHAVHLT